MPKQAFKCPECGCDFWARRKGMLSGLREALLSVRDNEINFGDTPVWKYFWFSDHRGIDRFGQTLRHPSRPSHRAYVLNQ